MDVITTLLSRGPSLKFDQPLFSKASLSFLGPLNHLNSLLMVVLEHLWTIAAMPPLADSAR